MISPERAEEIRKALWVARGWAQQGREYSEEEGREIVKYWNRLDGSLSFYDVVARMARGEHLEVPDA